MPCSAPLAGPLAGNPSEYAERSVASPSRRVRGALREARSGEVSLPVNRPPADSRPAAMGSPWLLDEHLLGLAPLAVLLLNDLGKITHWNDVATEIFGLARQDAIGQPLRLLIRLPDEHRDAFEP